MTLRIKRKKDGRFYPQFKKWIFWRCFERWTAFVAYTDLSFATFPEADKWVKEYRSEEWAGNTVAERIEGENV